MDVKGEYRLFGPAAVTALDTAFRLDDHNARRRGVIAIRLNGPGAVSEEWWELVTGQKNRSAVVRQIDRRYLEMCVLHQVSEELQAGDLCVPLGQKFRDYRRQLIAWEDYQRGSHHVRRADEYSH